MELAESLANSFTKKYPDLYSIIAVYGSTALNKNSISSDVDMFAIVDYPQPENSEKYYLQAVIEPHKAIDFYIMDWPSAERDGRGNPLWAVAASRFVNAKVLYSKSPQELERFCKLQAQCREIPQDEQLGFSMETGQLTFEQKIKDLKSRNDIRRARFLAWETLNSIVCVLARLNNVFLTHNWGHHLYEAFENFKLQPSNFRALATEFVTTTDWNRFQNVGLTLLEDTNRIRREVIQNRNATVKEKQISAFELDMVGLKEYVGKVTSAARRKDILGASYAVTDLELWFFQVVAKNKNILGVREGHAKNIEGFEKWTETELGFPNLTEYISHQDLDGLSQAIEKWDKALEKYALDNKISFIGFKDVDALKKYLEENEK